MCTLHTSHGPIRTLCLTREAVMLRHHWYTALLCLLGFSLLEHQKATTPERIELDDDEGYPTEEVYRHRRSI